MSHIFDALQRSEAERNGTDPSSRPAATELLERAERQAVLAWRSAASPDSPDKAATEHEPADGPDAARLKGTGHAVYAPATLQTEPRSPFPASFPKLRCTRPTQTRLVALTTPECPAAEAFRLLAVRLRHLRRDRTLRRLLITSSIPAEGKSLVSANLVCTLAKDMQQRTLVLEGDLRRPSLLQIFGAEPVNGVSEWLRGEVELPGCIYHLEDPGLWVLPAGSARGNPLQLLQSRKLPALMDQLSSWFDWVIIDSPPMMPLADTSIWARAADGVLLVTRAGVTEKAALQRALEAVEPKKLIGALLNSSSSEKNSYYYYYRDPDDKSKPGSRKAG